MRKIWVILEIVAVAILAGWFCVYQLGSTSFGLGDLDQTLHAKVVQEMVHKGNYLTPTLDGRPYSNKPPFKMWLTAGAVSLLGESTFSYRIVDGIVGTLFFLVFFLYARSYIGSEIGALSAFAALLACSHLFTAHGVRDGTQDGMLNLLLLLTLICAHRAGDAILVNNKRRSMIVSMLAGIFLGLALLTKSAGALIVLPVIACFYALNGSLKDVIRKGWPAIAVGCAIAALIPAVYLAIRFSQPRSGSWRLMWHNEVLKRAITGFHNRHSPWFYWNAIFKRSNAVPPLTLTLSLLFATYRIVVRRDSRFILPVVWAVVPVVCYSFVQSRLPWYIQFSYPGMALLVGLMCATLLPATWAGIVRWHTSPYRRRAATVAAFVTICICYSQLWQSMYKTAREIAAPRQIIAAERIVRSLQPGLSYAEGRGKIFTVRTSFRSLREERFYWDMLGNKKILYKHLSKVIHNPDLRILIVELSRMPDVARIRRPIGFTLFPPFKRRVGWIVAMYFDPRDVAQLADNDVILSEQNINLDSEFPQEFSGLSEIQTYNNTTGRTMLNGTASHVVRLGGQLGARLEYDVSLSAPGRPIVLSAFVGERHIGAITITAAHAQTLRFDVPPGVFNREMRTVTLRLTDETGTPVPTPELSVILHQARVSLIF